MYKTVAEGFISCVCHTAVGTHLCHPQESCRPCFANFDDQITILYFFALKK